MRGPNSGCSCHPSPLPENLFVWARRPDRDPGQSGRESWCMRLGGWMIWVLQARVSVPRRLASHTGAPSYGREQRFSNLLPEEGTSFVPECQSRTRRPGEHPLLSLPPAGHPFASRALQHPTAQRHGHLPYRAVRSREEVRRFGVGAQNTFTEPRRRIGGAKGRAGKACERAASQVGESKID